MGLGKEGTGVGEKGKSQECWWERHEEGEPRGLGRGEAHGAGRSRDLTGPVQAPLPGTWTCFIPRGLLYLPCGKSLHI